MHSTQIPTNGSNLKPFYAKQIGFRNMRYRVVTASYGAYGKFIPMDGESIIDTCNNGIVCKCSHVKGNETIWKSCCCIGMAIDIFNIVAKELNIEYDMYVVEDGAFGGFKNGSWNGIINELYTKRADIAVQVITPTVERLAVVDFTINFVHEPMPIAFVMLKLPRELLVVNWAFIKGVHPHLLFATLLTTIIIALTIIILEHVIYKSKRTRIYPGNECFSYLTGLLFQRDLGGTTPPHWAARFVSIIYAFGMTLIISSYTAQLAANKIESNPYKFEGLHDNRVRIIIYHFICYII